MQLIAVTVVVLLAVGALVTWIVMHGSGDGATSMGDIYYDAGPVERTQTVSNEVAL